ncbi:MAG: glycoside hydrolase family 43 protein [Ruminococcaceae bacterium]|nr:glycoside hydrolase family 43 protein [Oscillospiraceae bacterium]
MSEHLIQNPILPGFYPDPSMCRVGDDFYLITSSFELSPGIPIFHSKDLAHWEQIGHAVTPENGFEMECNSFRGGVMAPSIRYHKGVFYIINMNFSQGGNFIVTATDPAGPWSKPHVLPDVPGIDASLFFDDDDKCYIVSTGMIVNPEGRKERGIWCQEFDIENFCLLGERHDIWNCALHDAPSPEAPHLFRKDGYYYLLIGEGGTEHWHAVSFARSKNIFDWYEANPANPVLTHRHFGYTHPIANVGHADMVELDDGSWYAVMLASRIIGGAYKNLGRETYICEVTWERGWPIFAPGSGQVEWTIPAAKSLPWTPYPEKDPKDDFDSEKLDMTWVFWGVPYQDFWRVEDSALKLKCLPRALDRKIKRMARGSGPRTPQLPPRDDCAAVVLRRQQHVSFDATTKLSFTPEKNETAGLIIMQANNNQFRLELLQEDGQQYVRAVEVSTKSDLPPFHPNYDPITTNTEFARIPWQGGDVVLQLKVRGQQHDFYVGTDEENLQLLYAGADGRNINIEVDGCMVGTCLGMFASANGDESANEAAFDYFTYQGVEPEGEWWKALD